MDLRSAESGFSLLEVVVAMVLTAALAAVLVGTFGTCSGLSNRSTTKMQAHEEHRRNLEVLACAMRGAAARTLSGFDADWTTNEPAFQRVAGIDENGLVFEDPCKISWRATAEKVIGIDRPGELILSQGTRQTVLARRVPAESFQVTRLGRMLRIDLETYRAGPEHMLETISGHTCLTLRN